MKKLFIFLLLFTVVCCKDKLSQEENVNNTNVKLPEAKNSDSLKALPETFSYVEGDTTYVMQKYFMVFLKKGPNRDQDSMTTAQLQEQHMAHLEKMHLEGKICIAGPFQDESDVSGIVIYNTPTLEEADSLANEDPAVKAGRLLVETHPWWAAKGSKLR
ncbi:YciI family protein [Flavobacteriaceae bacterium M23B6Z8]